MFHPGWIEQIRQFGPEAIAAPVSVLKRLAASASYKGRSSFPTLTRAIVAFTGIEHGALSTSDRNMLWQAFEVPIFEQCLAPDGSLLAWECEAHEGLHTVEENAIVERNSRSKLILTSLTDHRHPAIRVITPLTASFHEGTCGCGQSGPRISGLAMPDPNREQALCAVVRH
jgi:phenylacetate-coenzyme A ligase PaaK-like adenylate-forming protein